MPRFIFLFLVFFLIFSFPVLAYDSYKIHPLIATSAIDLYNNSSDRKITIEEEGWITKGSSNEDTPLRFNNHFYNPETGEGLRYGKINGMTAKNWAWFQDSLSGDYSVSAILKNYEEGNKERAYEGIGHLIHLIQDMTVPAHTRNDAHPKGDPYEVWAAFYGSTASDYYFIKVDDINKAFDDLAFYSHYNFFSEDTVFVGDKTLYTVKEYISNGVKTKYLINKLDGKEYVLCVIDDSSINVFLKINADDFKLNLDYWNMLHPKAVGYSAGVIDYFVRQFNEIDKEDKKENAENLISKIGNFFSKTVDNLKYVWGDTVFAGWSSAENSIHFLADSTDKTSQNINFFVEANKEIINNTAVQGVKIGEQVSADLKKISEDVIGGVKKEIEVLGVKEAAADDVVSEDKEVKESIEPVVFDTEEEIKEVIAEEEVVVDVIMEPADNYLQPRIFPFIPFTAGDNNVAQNINYPETFIVDSPLPVASSTSASFIFSSNLSSSFECDLNNGGWVSCPENYNLDNLIDGDYILKVRALSDGNYDQTPAEFNWRIDTIASNFSFSSYPNKFSTSTTAFFNFIFEDDLIDYKYNFSDSGWLSATSSIVFNNLLEGEYALDLEATDSVNNYATSSYSWVVDYSAPSSSIINLNDYYNQNGFIVEWAGEDLNSASTSTITSGIKYYDVQYRTGVNDWVDLVLSSTATSTIFNKDMISGDYVYFRVRAYDNAGNVEDWTSDLNGDASARVGGSGVLISEIKIGGVTAKDEFIELYNPTNHDISLTGYQLKRKIDTGVEYNLVSDFGDVIIKSGGYILIVQPTPYNYSHKETLDIKYSSASYGVTADNTVILYNGVDVADKVGFGAASDFEGLPAPAILNGQSLARKAFGNSTENSMLVGADKQEGNGFDSNNNSFDFVIFSNPEPQNYFSNSEPLNRELIKPEKAIDLKIEESRQTASSTKISWTAPTNANIADGAYYDFRYSEKINNCDMMLEWAGAFRVASSTLPTPSVSAGARHEIIINDLIDGKNYCFGLRTFNGVFWSDLSNRVSDAIAVDNLLPLFSGNVIAIKAIANKNTASSTEDENIIRFDFQNTPDRGAKIYGHPDNSDASYAVMGYGNTVPATRMMLELVYNPDTMLFVGNYRFCTDNANNVNKIEVDHCKDGNFWNSKRWMWHIDIAGKKEISLLNNLEYIPWFSPDDY